MGDDAVEHAGADDHAAGMLAEMAGQILHAHAQVKIVGDARMTNVEAGLSEVVGECVVGAAPLPMANERGKARELIFVEAEGLADFARGGAASVADDVGGHGGAEFAVVLIDVLNDLLAVIAGG